MDASIATRCDTCVVAAQRPARGCAAPGAGPTVTVDESVTGAWAAAASAVREAMSARTDLDPAARVEILGAGDAVIVHVSLPDGRSTVRRVARPEDLAMTIEVLAMRPPVRPAPVTIPPPPVAQPAPLAPEPGGVEIGLGGSAHLTVSPSYFGYGIAGYAQVLARGWLVGAATRWDVDDVGTGQSLPDGFNMQAFQISSYVGRRVALGTSAIDVMLGPGVAIENQEALGPTPEGPGGTRAEAVVVAGSRWSRPVGATFRLFAGLAFDVFPSRIRSVRRVDPDLPTLPPWGLGVSVGAAWEDRLWSPVGNRLRRTGPGEGSAAARQYGPEPVMGDSWVRETLSDG